MKADGLLSLNMHVIGKKNNSSRTFSLISSYFFGLKLNVISELSNFVAFFILSATLDTSAVITFAFGSSQLTESYQMGWSFFVAVSMAIFTGLTFVVLLTSTLYCTYL